MRRDTKVVLAWFIFWTVVAITSAYIGHIIQ
jgi:hypothetical protein